MIFEVIYNFHWEDRPPHTKALENDIFQIVDLLIQSYYFHLSFLKYSAAAAAKLLQSCPTLCDPIDGSPPGFPVPGILQARTPELVAISWIGLQCMKVESEVVQSCPILASPWTAAYRAPPSMGFFRQKYWSGVPLALAFFLWEKYSWDFLFICLLSTLNIMLFV